MPLDSIITGALAAELERKLAGCRIDKVYQPSKFCFSMAVRTERGNVRLNISCSDKPYVYLSGKKPENPDVSPMFCMLLRKHLTSARILSVRQPDAERMIIFDLECPDELEGKSRKTLVCELMGRHSNLILCDSEGRIIDCARRVGYDMSELRQVLPNLFYELPPAPQTPAYFQITDERQLFDIFDAAEPDAPADKVLSGGIFGLPPLICREAVFRACGDVHAAAGALDRAALAKIARFVLSLSADGFVPAPYIFKKNGQDKYFDFCFMPITQYGDIQTVECEDFCAMMAEFYDGQEAEARLAAKKRELLRTLTAAIKREQRKLSLQRAELESACDRERLRRAADLIMANIYNIKKGADCVEVPDLFDPEQPTVKIALDPALDPHKNAQKYYKEYAKKKNAQAYLTAQIEKNDAALEYLRSARDLLELCDDAEVIPQIREELESAGYIRAGRTAPRGKKAKAPAFNPKKYMTDGGFVLLAGRSNRENEYLSLKYAAANDLWFHVKNAGGSHVLLLCRDGRAPGERDINDAAMLAAYNSSLRASSSVPVDYTRARFVKKLHGGAPGMVNYYEYKTAFATPDPERIEKMRAAAD